MVATPPTADEVRPLHCAACARASRPVGVGAGLTVEGHGRRDRLVMGVLEIGGAPVTVVVSARRFRCTACGCVMLVVPRELSPWRRYTLTSIALALAGSAIGESAGRLRARLASGTTFEEGWPTLRRWLRAVAAGKLFRWIRGVSELAGRALAERVSAVVAEASGISARASSLEARVWAGVMSSSSS